MRIAKMPYLQKYKGNYRFRRAVPDRYQATVGKLEWLETFKTSDLVEATRLALPWIASTNADLIALKNGTYTTRTDHDIRHLARDFIEAEWSNADREYTRHIEATFLNPDDYDPRFDDKVDYQRLVIPLTSLADLDDRLRTFLDKRHIVINPGAIDLQRFRDEAMWQYMELNLSGNPFAPVKRAESNPVIIVNAPASTGNGHDPFAGLMPDANKPFGDFLDQFLDQKGYRKAGQDDKTGASYRKAFARLEAKIGRRPVALVTTLDIEAFYQSLVATPTDKGDGYLKHDTIYRSISHIRNFYTWAEARHLAHDNPARKVQVENTDEDDEQDKRDPYSIADLNRIFAAPLYTGCKSAKRINEPDDVRLRDHRFWFPLVALFTGMRLAEIEQLEFEDIIDLNGQKHFTVNRTSQHGHTKKTKTRSSIRQVPVHRELIRLGFLKWVHERRKVSKDGRIFVAYRYGNWWNQIFSPAIGVKTDKKVFHSLRHTMKDVLTDAKGSDEAKKRILGHWREGTGKIYGGRDLRPSESKVIDGLKFVGLDLTHLMPKSGC